MIAAILPIRSESEAYRPDRHWAATLPHSMNKVPQVTFLFWVMKICATTLGETGGDLISMTLNVGYAASSLMLIGIFAATLLAQLNAKSFKPFIYWSVILSTSMAGTTMSDYMDRSLGLGYVRGSLILILLLLTVLGLWYLTIGSLSVKDVRTPKKEAFYWTAILISNTLGTALGDFVSTHSGLGFAGSALAIGSMLALLALAYFYTELPRVALFWAAFVLTRPFGAELGDLLTKTHSQGGLEIGTLGSSALIGGVLIGLILLQQNAGGPADAA